MHFLNFILCSKHKHNTALYIIMTVAVNVLSLDTLAFTVYSCVQRIVCYYIKLLVFFTAFS